MANARVKPKRFKVGDRVHFYNDASDVGSIAEVRRSNYAPHWDDGAEPLENEIDWYFVQWDEPGRPGEADPIVWWTESDLQRPTKP